MPESPALPRAKPAFILEPLAEPGWRLRTAGEADGERLRQWKNANRQAFFHQDIIDAEQQARWLAAYLERPLDFIFVLEAEGLAVGCLGWRLLEDGRADIYNVIRGVAQAGPRGLMGRGLHLMCSHILDQGHQPVTAMVVTGNPALGWYLNNGFLASAQEKDHTLVSLDIANFTATPHRRLPW
jgi:hypothetical protein